MAGNLESREPLDVFSKNEKWLGNPPSCEPSKWSSREQEVLGWGSFVDSLISWAAQASLVFGEEISHSVKWPESIPWETLSAQQRNRSSRLFAILKSIFTTPSRVSALISTFGEGISLLGILNGTEIIGTNTHMKHHGFELIRQLSVEYSIKSRAEALSFRAVFLQKQLHVTSAESSSGSVVVDTIRKVDVEASKYMKLLSSASSKIDTSGLVLTESDLLLVLLRALPNEARQFCIQHSSGESYQSFRQTARAWEEKRRLFPGIDGSRKAGQVHEVTVSESSAAAMGVENYFIGDGDPQVDQIDQVGSSDKCSRCGKRHASNTCDTDLSKVKCFRCNGYGHIGRNCKNVDAGKSSKGGKGVIKHDLKGKSKGKGGKSKGKGKKGKLNELSDDSSENWDETNWWQDDSSWAISQMSDEGSWWGDAAWQSSDWESWNVSSAWNDSAWSEAQWHADPSWSGNQLIPSSSQAQNVVEGQSGSHEEKGVSLVLSTLLFEKQHECVFEVDEKHVFPLLSELAFSHDSTWWLLDSGASVCVLSSTFGKEYGFIPVSQQGTQGFKAANGTAVSMEAFGKMEVQIPVMLDGVNRLMKGSMKAYLGNTRHNILSTTVLCSNGWQVIQKKDHVEVIHSSGCKVRSTAFHANCPWIQLFPIDHKEVFEMSGPQCSPYDLNVITRAQETELELHRQRNHYPFNPNCITCQRCRSVFQHRRRTEDRLQTELQADFMYVSQVGEVTPNQSEHSKKILALYELHSGANAFILVGSDVVSTRRKICQYLDVFGLKSSITGILLHTDAEVAVRSLVSNASPNYHFQVRRSAPQGHQATGGVEQSIRRFREALSILRIDLNDQGWDVNLENDASCSDVLDYLSLTHCYFAHVRGWDMSPVEVSAGRRFTRPFCSSFGSTILAELPDSIKELAPNESRSIEASFLHPGFTSGAYVQGNVRINGNVETKRFIAKNARGIEPSGWKAELCGSFMRVFAGPRRVDGEPQGPAVVPPSLNAPATGPPSTWIREHGPTENCLACRGLTERGSRKGKVHSAACKIRYQRWLGERAADGVPAQAGAAPRAAGAPANMRGMLRERMMMEIQELWFLLMELAQCHQRHQDFDVMRMQPKMNQCIFQIQCLLNKLGI